MDDRGRISRIIARTKDHLILRVSQQGICENFGQAEVRALRNKYYDHQYKDDGIWSKIQAFDQWCMNYTGQEGDK